MRGSFIAILIVLSIIVVPVIGNSVDELFLAGKVIQYEPDTGKIKIEVLSSSCAGLREFLTEKGLPKDLLINKVIYFGIDSSDCNKHKIHRITTPLLR
ncbi:MAG: hypothetical protein ACPLZA_06030 [Thermodesulfovibrio sp.]|uniref:Uncharacterized protein n=2 Tax=Thermodesulfovibrio TaxID=28261 RepID=A0A2J6WN62_9BACT|nr:MAG: hypothetical protein C0186_02590 [Thermodesulfovibrio aggregans]